MGTHAQLIGADPLYAELAATQLLTPDPAWTGPVGPRPGLDRSGGYLQDGQNRLAGSCSRCATGITAAQPSQRP